MKLTYSSRDVAVNEAGLFGVAREAGNVRYSVALSNPPPFTARRTVLGPSPER